MEHNIVALRERFGKLLDVLCSDYGLADRLDAYSTEDFDCEWEQYQDAADHLGIWTASGATKFVIGTEDCDYIIKFQMPCTDFDYCQREVDVYNAAKERGFADKFAWCAKLFDYEFSDWYTIPVYVMEWCQCSYDTISDEMDDWHYTKYCESVGIDKRSDDAYDRYNSEYNDRKEFDEKMMEWAYDCWGMDFNAVSDKPVCETIVGFMREMFINDIHPGNWGWCNNRLVLVDYSGYGDNFDERSILY